MINSTELDFSSLMFDEFLKKTLWVVSIFNDQRLKIQILYKNILLKIYITCYQRLDKDKSLQPINQQILIDYLVNSYTEDLIIFILISD